MAVLQELPSEPTVRDVGDGSVAVGLIGARGWGLEMILDGADWEAAKAAFGPWWIVASAEGRGSWIAAGRADGTPQGNGELLPYLVPCPGHRRLTTLKRSCLDLRRCEVIEVSEASYYRHGMAPRLPQSAKRPAGLPTWPGPKRVPKASIDTHHLDGGGFLMVARVPLQGARGKVATLDYDDWSKLRERHGADCALRLDKAGDVVGPDGAALAPMVAKAAGQPVEHRDGDPLNLLPGNLEVVGVSRPAVKRRRGFRVLPCPAQPADAAAA